MADLESFLTGGTGNLMVSSSSGTTTNANGFYAFKVNEDAVVSELYINGDNSTNIIDTYKLQGVTLKSGGLIRCNEGGKFTGIKLTSGSVLLLLC